MIMVFPARAVHVVDVSIVMPCLNERASLGHCISVARRALDLLEARHALTGEIVIADNASTDGSQELARGLGARAVTVTRRGYGAAVCGGFDAARGRYLVMGDADGSYDFLDAVPMVEAPIGPTSVIPFQGDIAGACRGRRTTSAISSDRHSSIFVPLRVNDASLCAH